MAKSKRTESPDPTDRVVVAARERTAGDGPEPASGGAGALGTRAGGDPLRREDREPVGDVAAESEGDGGSELLGGPSADQVRDKTPGADLHVGGHATGSSADPRERPGVASGSDAREAPDAGGLVGQDGGSDGDPLTSFLDAAEAKLGRGTGLADPSQQTNASPAHGQHSVARDKEFIGPDTLEQHESRAGVFIGPQEELRVWGGSLGTPRDLDEAIGPYAPEPEPEPADDDPPADTPPDNPSDPDAVTGDSDPPHEPPPEQPEPDPDAVTGEADPPHEPPPSPGPDEEEAPLPPELQANLDADVLRFRRQRHVAGDGTIDPSEIDEEQVGTASRLPTHAEVGQDLFGQPATDVPSGAVGGGTPNTGADSQGAGVINPGDDQAVTGGAQRDDDPFGEAGGSLEPAVDASDEGGSDSVLLPPDTIADDVADPAGGVPDALDLPD